MFERLSNLTSQHHQYARAERVGPMVETEMFANGTTSRNRRLQRHGISKQHPAQFQEECSLVIVYLSCIIIILFAVRQF